MIEGVDIAHLGGGETVASLVQFIDGLPFKPGYRRFRIQDVDGIDDFRSIYEVVSRRFRKLSDQGDTFPDILLIDGGKGQLNAAMAAFRDQEITPPTVISLAKKEEEIFRPGESESIVLSRGAYRAAVVAIRPRRIASIRPALPPHPAKQVDVRKVVSSRPAPPGRCPTGRRGWGDHLRSYSNRGQGRSYDRESLPLASLPVGLQLGGASWLLSRTLLQ